MARRILRAIAIALAFAVALAVLVLGGLATAPGRAMLASLVERSVDANGVRIAITGLSGWPPFRVGAERIVLSDRDGAFAEIDKFDANLRAADLLRGAVVLERVAADRVAVQRRPVTTPKREDTGASSFALERIALPRVELGPALAGRAATLLVAGSMAMERDGSLRANVNAERIDGKTAVLRATLARTRAAAPLSIDAALEEGDDGIVIGLLGRDAGPGYRLAVKTEASNNGASGTITLASSGTARFDGRFSTAGKDPARTIVVDGEGDLGEFLPADLVAWIGGPLQLAIDADVGKVDAGGLPRVDIRRGALTAAGVRATASGRLAGSDSDLTFKVDAGTASGAPLRIPGAQAMSLRGATLSGRATPADGVVRLETSGTITGFSATAISLPRTDVMLGVTSARGGPFARGALPFTLRLRPDAIATPRGIVRSTEVRALTFDAEGTLDTAASLVTTRATLAAAGARVTYDGDLGTAGLRGKATAQASDLRSLSAIVDRALAGAVDATATVALASDGVLKLDVDAKTVDFDPGQPTIAQLLRGIARIRGKISRNRVGDLAIADFNLDAKALQAGGNGSLAATALTANVDGQLADLSVLARDTEGALRFSVKASGARSAPTLDATLRLERGKLLGKSVEHVVARVEGRPANAASGALATAWSGRLALEGTYAGRRIDGGADATMDPRTNALAFPRIDVAVGEDRIRGAIARNARGLLDGTLDVAAPDLASLAALALVDVSGAANAKVRFSGGGARQKLALTLDGRNVKYENVTLGSVDGDIDIDDPFGSPQVRGRADAKAVAIGEFRLDSASARASIAASTTQLSISAKNADLDLATRATLALTGAAKRVAIESLTGSAYRVPLRLAAPASIEVDGERIAVRNLNVAVGGGSLRADGMLAPSLDVVVSAEKVSMALANVFKPDLRADGTISGRATITGKPDALNAVWQLEGSGLRATAARRAGVPTLAVSARGTATNADTMLEATITGGGATLNVKGRVPFAGSGLDVQADGTMPLSLLALQSRRELRLGGSVRANVAVTGALSAPRITGTADLVDATIADTETAFGLTAATGRIVFDGRRATLEQVHGRLLQGGDVAAGGTIDVTADGLPAAVTVKIDNGRFADGRVINTTFSGNLAIDGPLLGAGVVSGNVTLGRTEIQLPDRFGGGGDAIRVKHVNTPAGFRDPLARRNREDRSASETGERGSVLKLAVELTNTRGIFVRGFGVDAEFGGTLKLAGTIDSPDAIGAFTMRRGRIELLGKRLNLTSGRLTFAGELVPLLDFQATTTVSDTSVTASVIGPASDPVISMTSVPDLPQEEILSKLLFERSVGTLSPFQAAQLIDAIARFTGVRSGSGMLDRIRQATGLDDLDVRQNATGGTTVGLGRRLSDDVRLGVEAGSGSTAGRVTVDLDITKELKARGEAGQDGSGRIGLTYEHEY